MDDKLSGPQITSADRVTIPLYKLYHTYFFRSTFFFLFFAVQYNNSLYIFIPPTYILLKFRTLRVETPARNQWAHTLLTQQTTLGFVYEMATEPYLGYGTSFNTLLDITYMVSIVMIEIDRVISYISRTKVHASSVSIDLRALQKYSLLPNPTWPLEH